MTVAPWKRKIAGVSAGVLETLGIHKIGGGLPVGSVLPNDILQNTTDYWIQVAMKQNVSTAENTEDDKNYIYGESVSLDNVSKTNGAADTLIEFWSSQCSPCIENIPKLQSIYNAYDDSSKLRVLTVHLDLGGSTTPGHEQLVHFLKEHGATYPVGIAGENDDSVWKCFQFTHLPHGLIVDCHGKVLWSGSLFTHDLEKVIASRYGGSNNSLVVDADSNETKNAPSAAAAAAAAAVSTFECSGGVCRLSAAKK